jgi:hypothetical protein
MLFGNLEEVGGLGCASRLLLEVYSRIILFHLDNIPCLGGKQKNHFRSHGFLLINAIFLNNFNFISTCLDACSI